MLNRDRVFDIVGDLECEFDGVAHGGDNSGRVKSKTLVPVCLGDSDSDGVGSCVGESKDGE